MRGQADPVNIRDVSDCLVLAVEPGGAKEKHWFFDPERVQPGNPDSSRSLFKYARRESGEDWSEVLASWLAHRLQLPHAEYDLGVWKGRRGVISYNFRSPGQEVDHGVDLLCRMLGPNYNPIGSKGRERRQHTLKNIFWALETVGAPDGMDCGAGTVKKASDVFTGYLMLDCLIGNTDRHDYNWAVLSRPKLSDRELRLAPTYDHASCLGRELSDVKRSQMLKTHSVGTYAEGARCKIFSDDPEPRLLRPVDAFADAAARVPDAAAYWRERLHSISEADLRGLVERMPGERMSGAARCFAAEFLVHTRSRLLGLDGPRK